MTSRGLPSARTLAGKVGIKIPKFLEPTSGLLEKITSPKETKIPPLPASSPTPTSPDEDALKKGLARRRQRLNASGRSSTILTGGSGLGSPQTSRSSILGG